MRPTSATRPTVNPNNVTGAPTDKPRSDSLKYSTKLPLDRIRLRHRNGAVSDREEIRCSRQPALPAQRKSGTSNAIPPTSTETIDSVRISTPFAPAETLIPLAFQKRVSVVTYLSYGALMNTVASIDLPSAASSYAADFADGHAAIVNRRADAHRSQGSSR